MIEAARFVFGRLCPDEVRGEAFEEVKRIFLEWTERPQPRWPQGTVFSAPRKERHWSSLTSWAMTPSGVRYELLLERDDDQPDPRDVPPVLWNILVDSCVEVVARPQVMNMTLTHDLLYPVLSERNLDAWAGVPLGLARHYTIGRLSRPLKERTRTESEGWWFS